MIPVVDLDNRLGDGELDQVFLPHIPGIAGIVLFVLLRLDMIVPVHDSANRDLAHVAKVVSLPPIHHILGPGHD